LVECPAFTDRGERSARRPWPRGSRYRFYIAGVSLCGDDAPTGEFVCRASFVGGWHRADTPTEALWAVVPLLEVALRQFRFFYKFRLRKYIFVHLRRGTGKENGKGTEGRLGMKKGKRRREVEEKRKHEKKEETKGVSKVARRRNKWDDRNGGTLYQGGTVGMRAAAQLSPFRPTIIPCAFPTL